MAGEIIDAVRKGAPNLPLSIKTRLDVSQNLTKDWTSFLLTRNIDVLTLHGRDAPSMSKKDANWEEIGRAVEIRDQVNPEILVIGNGDVKSYVEVQEKCTQYKVDGVMIGRGIFGNPWIFDRTKSGPIHDKKAYLDLLLRHTKLFNDTWGTTKNFNMLKKFFKVYVKGFRGADDLRTKLMACRNYTEVVNTIGPDCNLTDTTL